MNRTRNEVSRCNIPKPQNYTMKDDKSSRNFVDFSEKSEDPLFFKSECEMLKEQLGQRNATILKMQIEMKEMKESFVQEKDELISKIESSNSSNSQSYEDLYTKLNAVIKENESLSKKLYLKDLQYKQAMIQKNNEIKVLNKQIFTLQDQFKYERSSFISTKEKYKSSTLELQEKHKSVIDILSKKIKKLEHDKRDKKDPQSRQILWELESFNNTENLNYRNFRSKPLDYPMETRKSHKLLENLDIFPEKS
ncbi:unnamed protein product [Moneuplotes crassus]|uniref:Uncharacterized protein n=1 Tax=Euplotes crassus TaxID=5936 RepID=A0AAD1XED9_EUPCR|nr:unnamed protein product [Moneuplotes crassus]